MADGRIRNLALWLQGWFAGWRDTPDWWTVILTAAMVVLTTLTFIVAVGTLIIFYGQFREMQTQTTILNCQARQAASDSKEAQKNFERQLQEAKAQTGAVLRVMRIDQRPWLSVTPAPPSQKLNGIPDEINADVVLANLGKT